jgi:hypothetical protein
MGVQWLFPGELEIQKEKECPYEWVVKLGDLEGRIQVIAGENAQVEWVKEGEDGLWGWRSRRYMRVKPAWSLVVRAPEALEARFVFRLELHDQGLGV